MRNKKVPKQQFTFSKKIVPKVATNIITSYYSKHPAWSFDYVDENDNKYSFFMNVSEELLKQFQSLERMTWQEIVSASGGKKQGSNSHFIPISDISRKFKKKLDALRYISKDLRTLFSLRLKGKLRLIGLIDENTGIFKIIWFDPDHEVYEINR